MPLLRGSSYAARAYIPRFRGPRYAAYALCRFRGSSYAAGAYIPHLRGSSYAADAFILPLERVDLYCGCLYALFQGVE